MQMSEVQSHVVMASNGGYGGQALGEEMAQSVKMLSSNPNLSNLDSRDMANAMNQLMPESVRASVSEAADQGVPQSTPGIAKNEPDRGI